MSKFLVETPISAGKDRLAIGAVVELTDELAAPLMACGAVKPVPVLPAKTETLGEQAAPAAKPKK